MIPQRGGKYKQVTLRKAKKRDAEPLSDCRQKAILPRRGRIALSANERIAEFLDFAIQAKFAYVNKLSRFLFCSENKKALIFTGKIKTDLVGVASFELATS